MLNLMDPVQLEDLVLFRDDEDARKFHILPDQPVIQTDDQGSPEFLFIRYLKDVEEVEEGEEVGGGYVQFRTTLTMAPGRRERVMEALRVRLTEEQAAGERPFGLEIVSTEPLLAAPLWVNGSVSLSTFQVAEDGLVRHATESAPVDLAGDLGASFRLELDPDGAEIFWGAFRDFRSRQIPILISYALTYKARVSARMEIHAERDVIHRVFWDRARPYTLMAEPFVRYVPLAVPSPASWGHLVALRAQLGVPVAMMVDRPLIRETVSKCVVDNDISVTIDTDEAGGGEEGESVRDKLFEIATDILTDRIVPALFGDGVSRPGAGSAQDMRAGFELVELTQSGGSDLRFDLVVDHRSTIERPVNPNGPVNLLVGSDAALERCFRELRLSDGFFDTMRVTASTAGVSFDRDGIDKVHLFLRYEQRDERDPARPMISRHTDGVLASPTDAVHWRFDTARRADGGHLEEYEYRTEVYYREGGPPTTTGWIPSSARMLLITPRAMGALRVEVVLTAPKEVVESARVELRYRSSSDGPFEAAIEVDHEEPARTWFQYTGELEGPADALHPPEYAYRVRYRAPGTELVTSWANSSAQTLEIPSPFARVLTFVVRPQGSFEGVSHLSGDIVYEDAEHDYRVVRSFQLDSLTASFTFEVPVFAGGPDVARWTARLNRSDGSSVALAPGEGPPGTVWVGTEIDFLEVQVLPDLIDFDGDVQLAVVQLRYSDPANAIAETSTFTFSKAARVPVTWRVARKDRALDAYDADVRFIAYDRARSTELHLSGVRDEVLVLDRTVTEG